MAHLREQNANVEIVRDGDDSALFTVSPIPQLTDIYGNQFSADGVLADLTQRATQQGKGPFLWYPSSTNSAASTTTNGTVTKSDDLATIGLGQAMAPLGDRSLKLVTDGAASAGGCSKTGLGPIDFTGKRVQIYVKGSDWTKINTGQTTLYLTSDGTFTNALTFSMGQFANFQVDQIPQPGEWVPVSFSWANPTQTLGTGATRSAIVGWKFITQDIAAGVGPQTVWLGAIMGIPEPTAGCVCLTFDDGWNSQYNRVKAYLDRYGYSATIYPIRSQVDFANAAVAANPAATPAFVTTDQLKQMQDISGWTIGCHADTQTGHDTGFQNMTQAQVEQEMYNNKSWLVRNGIRGGDHFAWPLGKFNSTAVTAARKYFASGRTLFSGSKEHMWPSVPTRMRAYLVNQGTTPTTINAMIDAAQTNKELLILVFHQVVDSPAAGVSTQFLYTDFQTIIDHCSAGSVPVKNISDALKNAT